VDQFIPKIEKVANFGANEPFVARIVMGLPEVIEATDFDNKEEIKEAIMEMFMNGLAPAFSSLQEIRKIEDGSKEKLLMDLRKEYFSFYDRLWAAYKDRMQKVIKTLGYDLGFIFLINKDFEMKMTEFLHKNPEIRHELGDYLRKNRNNWQNAVAKFRNEYAQHQSVYEKEIDDLLRLDAIEVCFKNCWTAIEMILMELICTKLHGWAGIEEIPETERNSSIPKRFRVIIRFGKIKTN
jgi:hypothetical protein